MIPVMKRSQTILWTKMKSWVIGMILNLKDRDGRDGKNVYLEYLNLVATSLNNMFTRVVEGDSVFGAGYELVDK